MTSSIINAAGHSLTLVAQVPKAGGRWTQVHFNRDVADSFFQISPGDTRVLTLERVRSGRVIGRAAHPLVFSESNKNCKVEIDFSPATKFDYPTGGLRPLVLMVELDTRTFRYVTLMPGAAGYDEMLELNKALPAVGRGLRRVLTTLDEVELRWGSAGLRSPA